MNKTIYITYNIHTNGKRINYAQPCNNIEDAKMKIPVIRKDNSCRYIRINKCGRLPKNTIILD